jgi:hypothetical protein
MDVFLHIPRTAGQSLSQLILQNYHGDRILFTGDTIDEVQRLSVMTSADYDACMGHIPWGIFGKLKTPVTYITFLRHPVTRHISEYQFHKHTVGSYHYDAIRAGLSLSEWFQIGRTQGNEIMRNMMCRFLSGVYVWDGINSRNAARAKETLCRMPAFGLTERFDESILMIGKALGLQRIFLVPTNTKQTPSSGGTVEISGDDDLFTYDLSLYDFAVDLFHDRMDRHGSLFVEALAAYREVAQELRREFAPYATETHGYEQPSGLIRRLKEIPLPDSVKTFYAA